MGRPKIPSGGSEIVGVKELFDKSVGEGTPDFRYLALAIGSSPAEPPTWAMLECRFEFERTRRRASSDTDHLHKMLDEIAWAYVEELARREDSKCDRDYPPPSFNEMVRRAYWASEKTNLPRASENDAYRIYSRKWNDEQENAVIKSCHVLFDWKITPRIAAVMDRFVGKEMGMSENPGMEAYLIQQLLKRAPKDL